MANHRSAEKRNRQSIQHRERNKHRRSMVRNAVKRARQAMETGGSEAAARVHDAERLLRRAASRGVLHKRTASRTVSRLYLALARGAHS
jgi:small subunit ribosomal protein S20